VVIVEGGAMEVGTTPIVIATLTSNPLRTDVQVGCVGSIGIVEVVMRRGNKKRRVGGRRGKGREGVGSRAGEGRRRKETQVSQHVTAFLLRFGGHWIWIARASVFMFS